MTDEVTVWFSLKVDRDWLDISSRRLDAVLQTSADSYVHDEMSLEFFEEVVGVFVRFTDRISWQPRSAEVELRNEEVWDFPLIADHSGLTAAL